jgi:hypothetical protein
VRFSIVCAWKDLGDPHRRAGLEFTRRYWRHHFPDAELVVGAPHPFTRARGLNVAVRAARYDLIVQADPDSVAPAAQIEEALRLAAASDGLVVPFGDFLYLDEAATARLHAAPLDAPPPFGAADCQQSGAGGCGPLTVFSRSTWERARGYDERFGVWGGDDGAFAYACDAYCEAPLRRVDGPMLHSFHPRLPQSIPGGEGYAEQFAILAEYRDAAELGRQAVRDLVEAR